MSYFEDQLRGSLQGSAFGLNDAFMTDQQRRERRETWQQHEYSRLDFQARQALARGLIAPEDFEEARSSNRSTWVQKALGWDGAYNRNNGSWLESLGDVLSAGGYASASAAEATFKQPAFVVHWDDLLPRLTPEQKKVGREVDRAIGMVLGPEVWLGESAKRFLGFEHLSLGPAKLYDQVQRHLPTSFRIGFAPSAYAEAWRHKTNYTKLIHQYADMSDRGEFWTGLAGDVFLDPTTYLTLGVSAGARATLKPTTVALLGSKGAATVGQAGGKVTLTRYGTELYGVAARRLLPKVKDELLARGEDAGRFLDQELAPEWHDRIVNYLVDNFDEVQQAYIDQHAMGLWNHTSALIAPASKTGRAKLAGLMSVKGRALTGYGLDSVFQETANLGAVEVGLYSSTKLQQRLARLPVVGKVAAGTFDVFDHGWDAPPALYQEYRLRQIANQTLLEQAGIDYAKGLGHIDKATSQQLAEVIEGRVSGVSGALAPRTEEQEAAMAFFRTKMDDILQEEQAHQFGTETVQGYVAHVINPEIRKYYDDVVRKSGEFSTSTNNRYAHQRVIANLAAGEEILGEGVFKKDLLDVLIARKRASLNLLQEQAFSELAIKQYGVPAMIVHNVEKATGMAKGLVRGWARRAGYGVHEVLTIDQVYRAEAGALKRLGFRDGDYNYNRALLSYLLRPLDDVDRVGVAGRSGRFSPAGVAEAEKLDVNQAARLHHVDRGRTAGTLSEQFRWRPLTPAEYQLSKTGDVSAGLVQGGRVRWRGNAPELTRVEDALAALDDVNHPLWGQVFEPLGVGGKSSKVNFNGVRGFLAGLHNYLGKNLDSHLGAFVPDVEQRVLAAWVAARARVGLKTRSELREKGQVKLVEFLSVLAAPLEVRKLEPQLPQAVVDFARATRRAHGILTDDTMALAGHRHDATVLAARLGFRDAEYRQLALALFGKDEIRTVAQADLFLETLRPFLNEVGQVDVLGAPARRLGARFGDDVILHRFTLGRRITGNVLPEEFDQNLGIPAAEGKLGKATVGGANLRQHEASYVRAGEVPPPTATYHQPDAAAPTATFAQHGGGLTDLPTSAGREALPNKLSLTDNMTQARAALEVANEDFQRRKVNLGKILPKQAVQLQRDIATLKRERKELIRAWHEKNTSATRLAKQTNLSKLRATTQTLERKYGKQLAIYKEIQPAFETSMKELQEANARVRKLLAAQNAERDTAVRAAGETFKGGVTTPRRVIEYRTPADELRLAREREGRFFRTPTAGVDREVVETGLADVTSGARAGMQGPAPAPVGRLRAETKPIHLDVYLPRSVGKLINDFNAPNVPAWLPNEAKRALLIYDRVMDFYKANLLLPWPGYWSRNAIQSGATTLLRHGLQFLHPEDNFVRARTSVNMLRYALGHYGSPAWVGLTKESWEVLGETEIKSLTTGRVIRLRDLDQEMRLRGIYKGTVSSGGEYDDMRRWGPATPGLLGNLAGVPGAVVGGAAGATATATAYGLTGDPNNPEAFSYASVFGGLAGALLGVRGVSKVPASTGWFGGLPVRSMNKATGLIQSGWKPLIRPLEAATELPFRVHMFTQEFLEHGSAGRAAQEVYRYLNDYHGLSPFERRWMRRIIPFYAWTKGALRITTHQLTEDPGRLGVYNKFFRDFNYAYDADPEDVPDYLTGQLSAVVADHAEIADREQQNNARAKGAAPYEVWAGLGLPVEDSVKLVQGLLPGGSDDRKEFLQGVLARGAFPLVTGFELLAQQDTFTGRTIKETFNDPGDWATAPGWLQALVGYQPEQRDGNVVRQASVNPTMVWVLQEVPVSRFLKLARSVYEMDESDRKKLNTYALARQTLGTSVYRVDPDSQRYFINRGRLEKMQQLLDHIVVGTFR